MSLTGLAGWPQSLLVRGELRPPAPPVGSSGRVRWQHNYTGWLNHIGILGKPNLITTKPPNQNFTLGPAVLVNFLFKHWFYKDHTEHAKILHVYRKKIWMQISLCSDDDLIQESWYPSGGGRTGSTDLIRARSSITICRPDRGQDGTQTANRPGITSSEHNLRQYLVPIRMFAEILQAVLPSILPVIKTEVDGT